MLYLKKDFTISEAKGNIALIGIPYDSSSIECPGQRFAPKSIRESFLKLYGYSKKHKKNVYSCFTDFGDLDIAFASYRESEKRILDSINSINAKKFLFLGGDHSISYATSKAFDFDCYISFDAHLDLFENYQGEEISHISHLYKTASEKKALYYVFGARAFTNEELNNSKKLNVKIIEKDILNEIKKIKNKRVYLSIDLDVLEFNLAIGTATPELYGISIYTLLKAIEIISKNNKILASDIVELNPLIDKTAITSFIAANIMKELFLVM